MPPPSSFGLLDCDQIANTSPLSQAQGVPHPTLSYDLLGLSTTNYHHPILLHTSYFYYSLFNSRETAILYNFRGPSHLQMVSRVIYPTGASRPYSCSSWARLNPTLTILGGLSKCAGKMMMSSSKAPGCSKATENCPLLVQLGALCGQTSEQTRGQFCARTKGRNGQNIFYPIFHSCKCEEGGFWLC